MFLIQSKLLITEACATPIPQGVVVVDGERIIAVGPSEIATRYPNSTLVDCSTQTVMPALLDSHSHLAFCGANRLGKDYGSIALHTALPAVVRNRRMYGNCLSDMRAGVTTIRSLGSHDESDISQRNQID